MGEEKTRSPAAQAGRAAQSRDGLPMDAVGGREIGSLLLAIEQRIGSSLGFTMSHSEAPDLLASLRWLMGFFSHRLLVLKRRQNPSGRARMCVCVTRAKYISG